MTLRRLGEVAYARSGDKGANANIGVIARSAKIYDYLQKELTVELVKTFLQPLGPHTVHRYLLPNLHAINFVLDDVLAGGGSRSLRVDAQGKALGQALLELPLNIPKELLLSL